jgi:hypothetical protein
MAKVSERRLRKLEWAALDARTRRQWGAFLRERACPWQRDWRRCGAGTWSMGSGSGRRMSSSWRRRRAARWPSCDARERGSWRRPRLPGSRDDTRRLRRAGVPLLRRAVGDYVLRCTPRQRLVQTRAAGRNRVHSSLWRWVAR